WLLACVNALNLIDGMDGLLGTVGLIALLSLAVIAAMVGHLLAAAIALALAGAVLGFLRYNLPPASVYMGDAGAMLIGLVIRVLVLVAALGLTASAGALASTALHNDVYALVAAGGVVVTLVATRLFGHAELALVGKRMVAAVRALRAPASNGSGWEMSIRLQG